MNAKAKAGTASREPVQESACNPYNTKPWPYDQDMPPMVADGVQALNGAAGIARLLQLDDLQRGWHEAADDPNEEIPPLSGYVRGALFSALATCIKTATRTMEKSGRDDKAGQP